MATYRVLLVGAGSMGKAWAKNLVQHDECEIAAWVDLVERRAESAIQEIELSDCLPETDLHRALAENEFDFAVDVTSPESHCEVTLACLSKGVPVLGEKPMADSMESARNMVQASEKAGKLYMVSQSRRYHPQLWAYRELISNLGSLGMLKSDFYLGPHFGGFRDKMPHPLLLDMAIHTFDAARFLSGADPISVYCESFNPPWSWYEGDACATAVFELTGGIRYTYSGSWCAEGCPTSWEADWRATCSEATALWNGHDLPHGERVTKPDDFFSEVTPVVSAVDQNVKNGIEGSLADFLNALKTGATPMGECHDNIKSLAMVFGAIESATSGEKIRVGD